MAFRLVLSKHGCGAEEDEDKLSDIVHVVLIPPITDMPPIRIAVRDRNSNHDVHPGIHIDGSPNRLIDSMEFLTRFRKVLQAPADCEPTQPLDARSRYLAHPSQKAIGSP